MAVTVTGMDDWLDTLQSLPTRTPKAFRQVAARAGVQMKLDWRRRWEAIQSAPTHIPHLTRGIGYDLHERGSTYSAEVGVDPRNVQAFLATIVEYGTLTSAPHPAGQQSLNAELPRMARAAGDVAVELLDEGR